MTDILSGGPDPVRSRPYRRWVIVACAVALAGAAAVLAVRSTPDPAGDPVEPSTAAPTVRAADPTVVAVAVGTRWAYALVSDCDDRAVPTCSYRLRRRDLGGTGWTTLPLHTGPRSDAGLEPAVIVTGDDVVTVVETPELKRVYASLDGGDTFTRHDILPGPPVDGVPEAGLLVGWQCSSCRDRLTVLEPGTGRMRPLRAQPVIGSGPVRVIAQHGDVLWAVAPDRSRTVTAASSDGGRTWRRVAAPAVAVEDGREWVQPLVGPDGRAYLIAARVSSDDASDRITGVWQADRPGAPWRRLTARGPRTVLSALAGDRGLLVAEANGALWRLGPAGDFGRLPDSGPLRAGWMVTGPSRVLLSPSPDDARRNTVLLSWDEGETWRVEKVT